MDISKCYKILNVSETSTNEDISRSYKKLAVKYHPDKNRNRIEWANNAMKDLNIAYASIMSFRFQEENSIPKENKAEKTGKPASVQKRRKKSGPYNYYKEQNYDDLLIKKFIKLRESAKDSLYRFFQYNLYNFHIREKPVNMGIFNRIVFNLRRVFHSINRLLAETEDKELLEHFIIFKEMIFNFYKASECLNIIDSYSNQVDVDAYRMYRFGDEALHEAGKEIFYSRHNRGHFNKHHTSSNIIKSIRIFKKTLVVYPGSTWTIETKIKLEYALSLNRYLGLFFNE